MLSVLVLLLVVAAASFAYRAFWMLRARPSSDEPSPASSRVLGQCAAVRVVRGRDGVGRRAGGRHGRLGVTVRRRFASGPSACPAGFRLVCGPDRRRLV